MKQLNNSSTPKGRKVLKRRILFFLFLILAVIASILALYLKRTVDQERKQDKIEGLPRRKKRMVSGTSTKSTKI